MTSIRVESQDLILTANNQAIKIFIVVYLIEFDYMQQISDFNNKL